MSDTNFTLSMDQSGIAVLEGVEPPLSDVERRVLTQMLDEPVPVYHVVMSGISQGDNAKQFLLGTQPVRIQFDGIVRATLGPITSDQAYVGMRTSLAQAANLEEPAVHSLSRLGDDEATEEEQAERVKVWLSQRNTDAKLDS